MNSEALGDKLILVAISRPRKSGSGIDIRISGRPHVTYADGAVNVLTAFWLLTLEVGIRGPHKKVSILRFNE